MSRTDDPIWGSVTLPCADPIRGAFSSRAESSRQGQCRRLYWVGTGRVTLRHVSPCPPLDPYVRLSPHTAHERGCLQETSISPTPRNVHRGQLARSLGTFVPFPYPLPQGLRHVRGFPVLGLLCPI